MKQALAATALILLAAAGVAQAETWTFTFTHLCSSSNCLDMHGSFSGVDVDADGVISLAELTSLEADEARFHPTWTSPPGDPPSAGTTHSFSYVIGGPLSFFASAAYYRVLITVETGTAYTIIGPVPGADTYAWTPETQQRVSPVPEPATALLLFTGLTGLILPIRTRPLAGPVGSRET